MNFRELVLTRRTVHNYHPDPVPQALVEEALALSLWVPNHKLTFPWAYTWIQAEARAALADLAVELKGIKAQSSEVKAKALRDSVMAPAHLISLGLRRARKLDGSLDSAREREDYATLACSVQIMSLHLWQHGVGTKWSTGGWSVHEKTYGLLGLSPSEVSLHGVLMIGRPQNIPAAPDRPDLSKVLR